MPARFSRFGWLLLLVPLLAAPQRARAQQWLADRASGQGAGVRVGDFELHPGFGAEIGYDSNVFNSDGGPGTPIEGAAILRLTPHLIFGTLSGPRAAVAGATPPAVTFNGGFQASYYHWFGIANNADNVDGDATLHLVINPGRPVSLVLDEHFARAVRPFTENYGGVSGGAGAATPDYGRNTNYAGVQGIFSTTGGVLSGRVGYQFGYDFFDDNSRFGYATNLDHQFTLGASYRFLPRTAIVYDLTGDYQTYPNPTSGPTTNPLVSNNFRIATRVGLNGALTSRISASAMVGYGAGFYERPTVGDYESIVAQLEVRWQITEGARLALGYDRNFFSSVVGNFLRRDRGYVNFSTLIGGQFFLGGEVAVGLYDFGTPVDTTGVALGHDTSGNTARSDIMLVGSIFAEYRFTQWLGLNVTLRYTGDFTDWAYNAPSIPSMIDPARFNKFEAFLGLRVFL